MTLTNDPLDHRLPDWHAERDVRRLVHQARHARARGNDADANALLREARASDAAVAQYQRALADARKQVADGRDEIVQFWERLADDRTLHDLAENACVLLSLYDDLDRAPSRLITLELTQP